MAISLLDEFARTGEWQSLLAEQVTTLHEIDTALNKKESDGNVFPLRGDRLNALKLTPPDEVKAIILAQDPYPGRDGDMPNAMGIALSVHPGVRVPASLKNMYRELNDDLGIAPSEHGDLTAWAKSGVLLLNVTLTVDEGAPNSHKKLGWSKFTKSILEKLSQQARPIVFLSLGRPSHEMSAIFSSQPQHKVIKTSHPSPLGYKKAAKDGSFVPFYGSRCFSECNEFLVSTGQDPIEWSLPPK